MKGHKGRKHRETGGVNEAEEDLERKSPSRTGPGDKVNIREAEERSEKGDEEFKRGGRARRKEGGKVKGEHAMHHAGRKPRKSGGRAQAVSETSPFSTARHGMAPKGRKVELEME